jgi:Family of unknown function (DUF5706)
MKDKSGYDKSASGFLKQYYEDSGQNSILFVYRFISKLAGEAKQIAESVDLREMDFQNAIVATLFRFAGISDINTGQTESMKVLLSDYFVKYDYPAADRLIVQDTITRLATDHSAVSAVEQVVSDAIYSQLADPDLLEHILLIKGEINRLNNLDRPDSFYLDYFLSLFIKMRYYTGYAQNKYSEQRQKNFELIEKRIRKNKEDSDKKAKDKSKKEDAVLLSNKETEDLFKIAFRNYNHLISVADSKASLLINVNSIIISVMIAFVLGKIEKSLFILWPTIILLTVSLITILLAILASRPQNNSFLEDKESRSYQRFFFGSFDLVDPDFPRVPWDEYYKQLMELFSNQKEAVYLEVYKESFNVRKVIARKFNYLSKAYWVFLFGLLISVIAFVTAIYMKG